MPGDRKKRRLRVNENGRTLKGSLPGVGGRPPAYQSPEEMEAAVQRWKADCEKKNIPLTITGLCIALGFASRDSLYRYGRMPEFADTVTRARLLVENSYEVRLYDPGSQGAQFALRNINRKDWTDRREITGPGGGPLALVNFVAQLPDDAIRRIMALPEEERRDEIQRLAARRIDDSGYLLGSGEE